MSRRFINVKRRTKEPQEEVDELVISLASGSRKYSSLWTAKNPARGQCGVTAPVIQDCFGGEILKTLVDGKSHFYNRINGLKYDFTTEKFQSQPNYCDFPYSREEAFSNTNQNQYIYLVMSSNFFTPVEEREN